MAQWVLDNAQLWIGDGQRYPGHVVVHGQVIAQVGRGEYRGPLPRVDAQGLALSPGLIDLMVLGGFNYSIHRDDPLQIAREYLKLGVTHCQFCSGTLPWDVMVRITRNIEKAKGYTGADAAGILGYYLEGPFQQPDLTGASQKQFALPPTAQNVTRIIGELGPTVGMINVAPGLEGAPEAVAAFGRAGKVVSMAHSDAAAEDVLACVAAGTSVLGHVWDNNSGRKGDSGVQQPTIEHVALLDERVRFIHLICDGVHVHPLMIQLVLRCRGIEALCLVTDAVIRAGCPDGDFIYDDGRHFYKKGGVGRTDAGWLNGSATLLPDMFRNLVRFTGLAPEQAIRSVSFNPAQSLGLGQQMGRLAPGAAADLVLWDEQLQVTRVWRGGHEAAEVSRFSEVTLAPAELAGISKGPRSGGMSGGN